MTLVSPPGQSDTQAHTHTHACTHRHTNTHTYIHMHEFQEKEGGRAGAGVISADCERTVAPLGELAIMGETMFTSISCQEDLWPHFAVMEN